MDAVMGGDPTEAEDKGDGNRLAEVEQSFVAHR